MDLEQEKFLSLVDYKCKLFACLFVTRIPVVLYSVLLDHVLYIIHCN